MIHPQNLLYTATVIKTLNLTSRIANWLRLNNKNKLIIHTLSTGHHISFTEIMTIYITINTVYLLYWCCIQEGSTNN